jgi:hypothetical protein
MRRMATHWAATGERRRYRLRQHLHVVWPGVITAAAVAPANEADRAVAP